MGINDLIKKIKATKTNAILSHILDALTILLHLVSNQSEIKMNSLQEYLLKEAIQAIQNATGDLVKDGEIDAKTLTQSMDEVLDYIKDAKLKIKTNVNFPLFLLKYEKRDLLNKTNSLKPIFVPGKKKQSS